MKHGLLLWLSVASLTLASPFESDAKRPPRETELCAFLKREGQDYLERTSSPGIAIGVVRKGKPLCMVTAGKTERGGAAITPTTDFHQASVSKVFVAVGVMRLVEDGRLQLDRPVVTYLPSFVLADGRFRDITARHLLTHMSGLPDLADGDYQWETPERDVDALDRNVRSLKDMRLLSAPGEKFKYSNIGYEVLGALIARVSSKTFEDHMAETLFVPAGMTRSSFLFEPDKLGAYAQPHVVGPNGTVVKSTIYPYTRKHAPSSTLHSNTEDMGRWIGAMLPPEGQPRRVLTEASWRALIEPIDHDIARDDPDHIPPGVRVGLGPYILSHRNHVLVVHTGEDVGFRSLLLLEPVKGIGITIVTNSNVEDPAASRFQDFRAEFGIEIALAIIDRLALQTARR